VKGIDQHIAKLSPDQLALLFERLGKARLAQAGAPGELPPAPPIARRPRGPGALPLSFAQERLWFLDQLSPSSDYNVAGALRIRGAVALAAFEQALREIVRRHEVLRASFRSVDGRPVQEVAPAVPWSVAHVDLGRLRRADLARESERLAKREAQRRFDLARAPLLRVCWLHQGRGDHLLVFTLHHVVCDAWSSEILTRELIELYRSFAAGRPAALPDLPFQYADYAEWQREQLQGGRLERLLAYWRAQLQGASAEIGIRGAAPAGGAGQRGERQGAEEVFALGRDVSWRLGILGREERATPFMTFAALFGALLYAESGQEDLCLGANAAHRGSPGTEELIGFFVNQIVLRVRPRPAGTWRDLLRQVRDVTQEAHAHQDLPFEKLVEALCPERSSSRSPLFQAKVDFQNDEETLELPGLELSGVELGGLPLRCDLLLTGWMADGGIAGALGYDNGRFRAETARRLVAELARIAEIVAAEPDIPLVELSRRLAQEAARQRSAERERLDGIGATKLKKVQRRAVHV
jgi:hypothetical protein